MKETIIQFVKFGLVGAINTVLSLVIYWICIWGEIHYLVANAIGFFITVTLSYVLNNIFTFRGDEKAEWALKGLCKVYISYSLTGLLLNSFLLWLWTSIFGINQNLAPVINLLFTIPLNFILNKKWAYKK